MRYFAANTEAGPMVAADHGHLGTVAVCECLSMDTARFEAMRLNSQAMALEHIAQRDALRKQQAATTQRRAVRFFPNEDVHG